MRSVSIFPMFDENMTNPYQLDNPSSRIETERRDTTPKRANSNFPTTFPGKTRNVFKIGQPSAVRRAGDYNSRENTPAKVSTALSSTVNTADHGINRQSLSVTRSGGKTSRPRYSQNHKEAILGWHAEGHNKEKIIEMFRETFGDEPEINAVRLNSFLGRWAPKQDRSKEPEFQPQVRRFQLSSLSF